MFARLAPTSFLAASGLAALVVFAAAFVAGRLTAPSSGANGPTLQALHAAGTPRSLPHLSQAVPLPALAAAPAPAARQAAPAAIVPQIHRSKPSKPGGPVDIVGSG